MIMTNRLDRGFQKYQQEFEERALEVLRSGWYVLGKQVQSFEEEFAGYIGSKYCVGLASGLDALSLAFRALGIGKGDEVIVQANTYIASVLGITMNGATPVFVEPDEYHGLDPKKAEEAVTERTKAVLAVHLYGQPCRMDQIVSLCKDRGLFLVEDCAQSHGAGFQGKMTGTFGEIGCFSFYPSKNLGGFGDGGAIVTDSPEYADQIRMLRNYGSKVRYYNEDTGVNSRLDELQAGLLRVRLTHLDELNEERKMLAWTYLREIKCASAELPLLREDAEQVWHQFVIRCRNRDALQASLKENGVDTLIHYPVPPHLQKAYAYLGHKKGEYPFAEQLADEVLSIPMYTGMTEEEQNKVIDCLNRLG